MAIMVNKKELIEVLEEDLECHDSKELALGNALCDLVQRKDDDDGVHPCDEWAPSDCSGCALEDSACGIDSYDDLREFMREHAIIIISD